MNPASILITDDESNIRMMLRTALSSEGYDIEEASNGREALDAIQKRVPDVMILDLSMPVLDGMSVLEHMKVLAAKIRPRIVVLTAYGSIPAAVKATRLGAIDFLEKPVLPTDVRESVRAALKEPVAAEGSPEVAEFERGYASVLDRARKALRLARYGDAESLLMKAADLSLKDPAYLNLLGVIYESRKQWRLAQRFYSKAIDADAGYEPAKRNIRRVVDLRTSGRTAEAVALGDEADLWLARLPEGVD